ncbi:MAG: hypothetical protein FJ025_02445 [Chloroflexi bacterium]|nr:hypothetical protein [Chloroflexota bacterium]
MAKNGIVDIGVYQATMLKEGKPQDEIEQTFNAYHSLVENTFNEFGGKIWRRIIERSICVLHTPTEAVDACIQLLENLVTFNKQRENLLSNSSLFVRVGIHEIEAEDIANVPGDDRVGFAHPALDIAGKLQENCPIGKIAISMEVYEGLGLRQRLFRPTATRLGEKRNFVLTDRLIMPQEENCLNGLLKKQKMAMAPIPFANWDNIKPDEKVNLRTLDEMFREPLLVILGETSAEPKGPICSAATSDAVGMMEVLAALGSNREVRVGIDHWEDTADVVSDRNVIIIGSGTANIYAFALNDIIHPVHFVKTRDRVLDQIVATSKEGELYFGPHASPPKDAGLIIISKNPFNLERTLLWIAGITGIGTQAVANLLRDLILDTGSTLMREDIPDSTQPIACVAGPDIRGVGNDWGISDYYKRLRILDYKIAWMVDRSGNMIQTSKRYA